MKQTGKVSRDITIKQLIVRASGISVAENYFSYKLKSRQVLAETAQNLMSIVPPSFGECALLSASWAGFLQEEHSIPAIVVAGDLKIKRTRVFRCKKNIPVGGRTGKLIKGKWDGHCWIEIDGYIGDLSIFRTAYSSSSSSILKEYILSTFGWGRGCMISPESELPMGIKYIPKYVLKDDQINCLAAGMSYKLEKGI
jgi:hypothetical protein